MYDVFDASAGVDIDKVDDPYLKQAMMLNDLAMRLSKEDKHAVAISMLHRAATLAPHLAHPWSNLGLLYYRTGEYQKARECLQKSVDMDPDNAAYHGNLGVWESTLGDFRDAERHLTQAMELKKDNHGARWDRSLLYLRQGMWDIGLEEYESRFAHNGPETYPGMPVPTWQGEDLNHKTLYVQGEQGYGDRILFSRYIPWVKNCYPTCKIKVCLGDDLTSLLWEYRKYVEFLPSGIPWPKGEVDYGIWLLSLPKMVGKILPEPGLIRKRILSDHTTCKLPPPLLPAIKVGIAWTGSPTMKRNIDRKIPLEKFLPLAEDPRVQLYSFQCGEGRESLYRLGAENIIVDLSDELEKGGWVKTALAMQSCDLIITTCTSIAHLAGSLRTIPTWTLLCADPYWIWGREGDRTLWYPNMRLIRQKTLGDWNSVFTEIKADLTNFVESRFQKHISANTEVNEPLRLSA